MAEEQKAEQQKVRVSVPERFGPEITVRWDGDDPTTYPLRDGVVEVEPDRLDRFLSMFEGSKAEVGNTGPSKGGKLDANQS